MSTKEMYPNLLLINVLSHLKHLDRPISDILTYENIEVSISIMRMYTKDKTTLKEKQN